MTRTDRTDDALRRLIIEPGFQTFPQGSCLVCFGRTRVICAATIEERVPGWMAGSGRGWVTAEYAMLPSSTPGRSAREATKGKQKGRTLEIQRLVGRALRACVDLEALGERQVRVDCDVIDADGGTRTASVTGGYVALALALAPLVKAGAPSPLVDSVSAISAGLVSGRPMLDLEYVEDSRADVDMNFVITGQGGLIEVQGTAEGSPFDDADLGAMLALGRKGCSELARKQVEVLVAHNPEMASWLPRPS